MNVLPTLSTMLTVPQRAQELRLRVEAADDLRALVFDPIDQKPAQKIDRDKLTIGTSGASNTAVDTIERALRDARDPRTVQFLIAVRALRVDQESVQSIPPEELTAMRAAAAEIFNIENDIPQERQPIDLPPSNPVVAPTGAAEVAAEDIPEDAFGRISMPEAPAVEDVEPTGTDTPPQQEPDVSPQGRTTTAETASVFSEPPET